MKKLLYLLLATAFLSCNNERVLQLPEIESAEIIEVLDVSPAYIFYDETQPDSTLFNRKNLIGTTNWLVNVDKRLTLRQAIPHIKYLQDKRKKASMHKNEAAKNYFTCNDTSIKNLGFLEFSDVDYTLTDKKKLDFTVVEKIDNLNLKINDSINLNQFYKGPDISQKIEIMFDSKDEIYFGTVKIGSSMFQEYLSFLIKSNKWTDIFHFRIHFNGNLNFQDYISIKSKLSKVQNENIIIDKNEFIY